MSNRVLYEKNYTIYTLKFFAIVSVIGIHASPFLNSDNEFLRSLGVGMKLYFRCAVPLFFICTGYLFYNNLKKYGISYVKKYIIRIFNILITAIFICLAYYFTKIMFFEDNFIEKFKEVILYFISNMKFLYYGYGDYGMYHLWYLYALIYIMPIIYLFTKRIKLLLSISLVLNIIGVIIQTQYVSYKTRDAIMFGLLYVTLGYYICENEIKIKTFIDKINKKFLILTIFVLGLMQLIEGMLVKYFFSGGGDYFIMTLPFSISIFLLAIRNKNIFKNCFINELGKASLGIYIIHVMVINIIEILGYKLYTNFNKSLIYNILIIPIVLLISYNLYKGFMYFKNMILDNKNLIHKDYNLTNDSKA